MNTNSFEIFTNLKSSNIKLKLNCFFNFTDIQPNTYITSLIGKDRNIITGYISPAINNFWTQKSGLGFLSGNYIYLNNISKSSFNFNNFSYILSLEKSNFKGGVLLSSLKESSGNFLNTNGEIINKKYYKGFEFGITANNYLYFEYFKNDGPIISISDKKINDKSIIYLNIFRNNVDYGYIDFNTQSKQNKNSTVLNQYFYDQDDLYIGYNPNNNNYSNNQPFIGYLDNIILFSPKISDYELLNMSSGYIFDYIPDSQYVNTSSGIVVTSYKALTGYRQQITGWDLIPTGMFTNPWGIQVMGYLRQPLIKLVPLSGTFFNTGVVTSTFTGFSGQEFRLNNQKLLSFQKNTINFLNQITNQDIIDVNIFTGYKDTNVKNIFLPYERFSNSYRNLLKNKEYYNIFANGQLQQSGRLIFSNIPYETQSIIISDDFGINPVNGNNIIFNNLYGLQNPSSILADINLSGNLYFENIENSGNFIVLNNPDKYDIFLNGQKLLKDFDYTIIDALPLQTFNGFNFTNENFDTLANTNIQNSIFFIYTGFDLNQWIGKQIIQDSNAVGYYNKAVIKNDLLFYSIPQDSIAGKTENGALYVRSGNKLNGWSGTKLISSGKYGFNYLGLVLDVSDDYTIVTSIQEGFLSPMPPSDELSSPIIIYTGNYENNWKEHQILSGFAIPPLINSVNALKINKSGNIIVVGQKGGSSVFNIGALIYTKNNQNQWFLNSWLTGFSNSVRPGFSVDLTNDGSVIIIGDAFDNTNGSNAGAFHIYTGNMLEGWSIKQSFYGINEQNLGSTYGRSLSINSNNLTITSLYRGRKEYVLENELNSADFFVDIFTGNIIDGWNLDKKISIGAYRSNAFAETAFLNNSGNLLNTSFIFPNISNIYDINNINSAINFNYSYSGVLTAVLKNYDLQKITSGTSILNLNNNFYNNNTEVYVNGIRQSLNYDYLELSKNDASTGVKILLENNKDYIYNNEGFLR